MYAVTVVDFVLWSVFGFLRMEWPIILTNKLCFCLLAFILMMKTLPRRRCVTVLGATGISDGRRAAL